jgi:PmbA protein
MSTDKQFEICTVKERVLSIEVRDHEVVSLDNAVDAGSSARVIKDGRLGFAYSTEAGVPDASLVAMAEAASRGTAEDNDLAFPAQKALPDFRRDVRPFLETPTPAKIELVKGFERAVLSFDKRIKSARRVVYDESVIDTRVRNSLGVDHNCSTGLCAVHATVIAEENGEVERATDVEYAIDPHGLDIPAIARRVASHAVSNLGARKISSRKCPCILDNTVVAEMLAFVAQAFFADQVFKRKSPLHGRLGEALYSEAVTIIDDGVCAKGISSAPFDAEGEPCGTNVLVEGGVFKACLSDTLYARKMGIPCTASSVRQHITQMPRIGARNFQLLPGRGGPEGLKKEMVSGLYIKDVMGLHTANPVTGEFSVGAAGSWVANGEEVYGVKGVTIAGSLHDMLKRAAMCASDMKFMHTCAAPSVLIEEMVVSGS